MKLPADPESRTTVTEITRSEAISVSLVVNGMSLIEGLVTELTMGRGAWTGHVEVQCPPAPQYKHRFWVSRWNLSVGDKQYYLLAWAQTLVRRGQVALVGNGMMWRTARRWSPPSNSACVGKLGLSNKLIFWVLWCPHRWQVATGLRPCW